MNNNNFLCHRDDIASNFSRCHDRDDRDDRREDRDEKQIALNSSTGGAGPLPCITTLFADPINVVSTTIDTKGMKKTNNLLIFTSVISLPLGISVTLNFQVVRSSSEGGTIKVGPTNTFKTKAAIAEAEAFSFQFFDTQVEAGNYTYSVEISTNSIIDITPGATVNNATLSIIATRDKCRD